MYFLKTLRCILNAIVLLRRDYWALILSSLYYESKAHDIKHFMTHPKQFGTKS